MPHIHEKIDFTVDVLIVNKDRVLLRMHDKYKIWLPVGGHIELDEDPVEAAIREVWEEVGLNIVLFGKVDPMLLACQGPGCKEILPPRFVNRHPINDTHEHISFIYFATSESRDINPQHMGDVSDECHWFSVKELIENSRGISEPVRFYALTALKTILAG